MSATVGQVRLYASLTEEEKEAAREVTLRELLEAVCEGAVRFDDALNGDDLQARIDRAWTDMEAMQTPWFIGERIMNDETLAEALRGMALCDAEDALYPDADARVIRLPRAVVNAWSGEAVSA